MAKPSSPQWCRLIATNLCPRGDALLLLLAVVSILSLLTHELSRRSALAAADFEGFDSDELDDDDNLLSHPLQPASPPPTILIQSSTTPESHHGPPLPPSDLVPPPPSPLDFWDEDEFEGIPLQSSDPDPVPQPPPSAAADPPPRPPVSLRSYAFEISCITFLVAFSVSYFTGRRENERIALSWASRFATKDSVFDKNFSLLGTGDGIDTPLLLKEGQDVFKFYASGRRYCQGMLATMELRARHDLIARVTDTLFARRDTITFEVVMNEDAMDQVVVAVARRKAAKSMHKEAGDLQLFANVVATPPSGRRWVAEDLVVISESKEVAGDLLTEVVLDQVFGESAFEKFGKGFISMHFSDQHLGSHKKILVFKFALPDAVNMADMTRLVTLVPYYIELVGRYKLSSQARSKAEAARAKAAQEASKELQYARQEALQKRKAGRKKMIEEAEAMLGAEAIHKKEEKERSRLSKKSMPRVKMLRSH